MQTVYLLLLSNNDGHFLRPDLASRVFLFADNVEMILQFIKQLNIIFFLFTQLP